MENTAKQNKQDKKRCKQLMECIKSDDIEKVRTLLESKLDVNTMVNKEYPLVRAAAGGKTELVSLLLKAGADPDKCETVFDNYGGPYINTCALLECSRTGDEGADITQMLLEKGADIHILDDQGKSALENAVIHSNIKMIDLLLKHGASVNEKGESGERPLDHSCLDGNIKVAEYLIEKGAEINPKDSNSPLAVAAVCARLDTVAFLLSKGADPNHKNDKGETALLQACYCGSLPVVKILVEGGADVNTCNNTGDTCIHFSCFQYPNKMLVKYLVGKGADLYAKNSDGNSAFYWSYRLARYDAIIALLGAGFDIKREEYKQPEVFLQTLMLPLVHNRTHPEKLNKMAELLVALGFEIPSMSSVTEISKTVGSVTDLCDWLNQQKINAKSLKNICRLSIRNLIGLSLDIDEKIESLSLPEKLKEFLRFEELLKSKHTDMEVKHDRCLGCNEYMDECECRASDYDYYDDYEVDWGSEDSEADDAEDD